MHVELLGQLGQRLLALHGGEGHLRLEGRGVVPARSSRHRLSLPAAILAAVRQKLHPSPLSRFPEPARCPGARRAGRPVGHRLEARHRPAGPFARGGRREARLVRPALADRAVPQDPEIRLPSRGGEAADRRAPRQPARPILYPELAAVLADHAQPRHPGCLTSARLDRGRSIPARRMAGRPSNRSPPTLPSYLPRIARLGAYLARASDPPPGNTVIWRGWSRLMDIKLGAAIAGAAYG